MSKGFASSYRIVLLATGIFVCFGGMGMRLVWLHVIDRDSYLKDITKARKQFLVETARRGDIRDARGAILATSRSMIVVGVDPSSLRPQDEKKWPQLATMLGLPEAELRRIFTTKYGPPPEPVAPSASEVNASGPVALTFKPISGDAGAEKPDVVAATALPPGAEGAKAAVVDQKAPAPIQWAKLSDEISESTYAEILKLGVKGVYGRREYRRAYPNNQLAAHLIGYVNRQEEPAAGIEAYADIYLRGHDGWRVGERDAKGNELAQFRTREVPAASGYSVTLSIQTIVQDIIEEELANIARTYEPLKATIIVSEPRTGWILGLANYPTFNPNEYNKVPKDELERMKNVAVTDVYEPGSVFKIVAVSAALEERLATRESIFDVTPTKAEFEGTTFKLPDEDHHFTNPKAVTLAEVVAYSSNHGAANLGMRLGKERLYAYARAFGFGSKYEFPVGPESPGIFNNYKKWYPIDISRIAIGHSISATALQMHQAMTVIANDGVLMRPQMIRQVRDASGEIVYHFDKMPIRRVISAETARAVAQMLTAVASKNGTAPAAAIEGFDVAGKTGTTQKLIDGAYSSKNHVVSFVGFFPASAPQVAISVIIDDADHKAPNHVAYGGFVAAPSFKRIGERLIPILEIKPQRSPAKSTIVASNEGGRR
jgi:cell division protein FtsI/penicillin-binding protein 2